MNEQVHVYLCVHTCVVSLSVSTHMYMWYSIVAPKSGNTTEGCHLLVCGST